jgi:ATP-dependent helicase/nuclease subunit B
MVRVLKKSLQVMAIQLAGSDFSPVTFEQAFSHTDRRLRLYGIIDRVDVAKTEDAEYIKIVDYKSGNRDFSPEELYDGLSMQLAVYMAAVMRTHPEGAVPAGMFYYHLDDPLVEKADHVEAELLRKLRVKGMVYNHPDVIRSLDHDFVTLTGGLKESVKSLRIPVETDKNGDLKKASKVASREQFQAITGFVYDKLQTETEEILSGAAEIAPYKLKKKTGCDYCPYASVCGFDKKNGGRYRVLVPLADEEVFARLCKEEGKD